MKPKINPVVEFQKANGLTPDGTIGKKSLALIKEQADIQTDIQLAHFMGQMHHESGGFTKSIESTFYTDANRLAKVIFKSDFDKNKDKIIDEKELAFAQSLCGKPVELANFVYANQNGNGDITSGDGYFFRGHGPLQLTGRRNFQLFANAVNDQEIMKNPALLVSKYYFRSADWFFDTNNIWKYCIDLSDESILNVSKMVNLGNIKTKAIPHGLNDRKKQTLYYANLLK
jgi:putative chitinase